MSNTIRENQEEIETIMAKNSEWLDDIVEMYKEQDDNYRIFEANTDLLRALIASLKMTSELLEIEGDTIHSCFLEFLKITEDNLQRLETDVYEKIVTEALEDIQEEEYLNNGAQTVPEG